MKKKLISVVLLVSILLSSVFVSSAAAPTVDEIVAKAAEIIKINEGDYKSVNKNDNGALSIGWIQWHGNRALDLLRSIVNANPTQAKTMLGTTLYNEVMTTSSWSTRILTDAEASSISSLISTTEGKKEQDKLAASDIRTYVLHGQKLGITSATALVYFADMENQCGSGGATRVAKSAISIAGTKEVTLAILHQAALADSAAGKYAARRNKVYNFALLLGWENIYVAYPYEIWTVNSNLNIRNGPGTSYTAISQYPAGTTIIVYEKTLVGDSYWGRTSVGWISLTYCTHIRSVAASTNAFKVNFDPNGGSLNINAKTITTVNGINTIRLANTLVVYTPEYGATTYTNSYGTEVVIGPDGIAQNSAKYGTGDSKIPSGGFVISAHGTAADVLYNYIQKGNYVIYNAAAKTIDVYSDHNSYIASTKRAVYNSPVGALPSATKAGYILEGWYDQNGVKFTEQTAVSQTKEFTLTARWSPIKILVSFDTNMGSSSTVSASIKADGLNVFRNTDMLVIYDSGRGAVTNTNSWGTEASVNSAGMVTNVWEAGTSEAGSHPIPSGGFVVSGHGTKSTWILKNIKVGNYVQFNKTTYELTVSSSSSNTAQPQAATYDSAFGALPVVTREGYTFAGWFNKATGEQITATTICKYTSPITLQAKWTKGFLRGDVDGNGEISLKDYSCLKFELLMPGTTGCTNLDVDGDGEVSLSDYTRLKFILLGVV